MQGLWWFISPLVSSIPVSQGCVATFLSCAGIFNDSFIANCLQSVPVNQLLKWSIFAKIWAKVWRHVFIVDGVFAAAVQERLRRESLEREKQIEQDKLNSRLNEEKRQEVCRPCLCHLCQAGHVIPGIYLCLSVGLSAGLHKNLQADLAEIFRKT